MDIRQLRYFIAVAEARSFSRASERIHISQPPLTRQIHALEDELGVELFERKFHGVELTSAGEALLRHARRIQSQMELAIEQARLAGKGLIGEIDIGVVSSVMLDSVPRILDGFIESHPDVKIIIHCASKEKLLEALCQRRILIFFDRCLSSSLERNTELVCREPVLVVLNSRNPLSRKSVLHPADLHKEVMISEYGPDVSIPSQVVSKILGFEPISTQNATDMISAVIMVSAGFGCCLVPESMQELRFSLMVLKSPLYSAVIFSGIFPRLILLKYLIFITYRIIKLEFTFRISFCFFY